MAADIAYEHLGVLVLFKPVSHRGLEFCRPRNMDSDNYCRCTPQEWGGVERAAKDEGLTVEDRQYL